MTATMTVASAATPRSITENEAASICRTEYARLVELLRALTPEDWTRPTDCTRWTVRDIVGHLAGAAENTGFRTMVPLSVQGIREQRALGLGEIVDGMNEVQIRAHANDTHGALIEALVAAAPRQSQLRRHPHWYGRLIWFPTGGQVLSMRDLFVKVLNRDLWIHRVDICRATGHTLQLTAEHDGRLVEDIVADWAHRHRQPFTLRLTGVAGGTYARGSGGHVLELDAVEFCRIVSGRAHADGLLATGVIF